MIVPRVSRWLGGIGAVLLASHAAVCGAQQPQPQLPAGWAGVEIGGAANGTENCADGVYTITGSGTGFALKGDQLHFTYQTLPAGGNFRLTARISGFFGGAGAAAGLAMRENAQPTSSLGAVAYEPAKGTRHGPNAFHCFVRDAEPGALYPWKKAGTDSVIAPPCWLQLVRYGDNFAVYRSSDGAEWAQVQSDSGGAFAVNGGIQVGFFVYSGGSGTASATIDHVTLDTTPVLPYETSWIGNTFSTDHDGFVSASAAAMWVAADGTCYVSGSYDEGGVACKSYQNGRVRSSFTLKSVGMREGSIACDGSHLYYFGRPGTNFHELYQTDLAGSLSTSRPLYFETPLLVPGGNSVQISGLAYGNQELYVSSPLAGKVLVADPNANMYGLAPNVVAKVTNHAVDTSGVANGAPEAVYQSAFQSDLVAFTIPGLTAGSSYTVRLHFAELNPENDAPGQRLMNLSAGRQSIQHYDIFATAGALYKATAVTFEDVQPDAAGNLRITAAKGAGTIDGWATINGVEILHPDGTPCLALNCGGSARGVWQSMIQEIPARAFPVIRPGPIALDKHGHLWIVQEGTTFPASRNFTFQPGWAAIKLYDRNGHYLNKQITDLVNPTAVSYDAARDRLLVAENGPAQNVRIYQANTDSPAAPTCTGTLGIDGGIFAGKTPGLFHDPDAGGDARFFGPTGVGADSAGNVYVACNGGPLQTQLRAFTPDGALQWSLYGMEFCNTGDFDPTRDASDVWTPTQHYTMDYSGNTAGGEWKLKSYLVNPFAPYPVAGNFPGTSAVYRKIGADRVPIMYTAGQGQLGTLHIYRFVGEQIMPCGSLTHRGKEITLWVDANGDGVEQPEEVASLPVAGGGMLSFDVDDAGNLHLAMAGTHAHHPNVQKVPFTGFNAHGVPTYGTNSTTTPAPPPFDVVWGNKARLRYAQGKLDTMYLLGETNPGAGDTDFNYGATLACYDHWSTNPTKRFIKVMPTPATDPNFCDGAPPFARDGFIYQAFDVANGYAFVTDLWGMIRVIDPAGNPAINLIPGPEVNGMCAWEDEIMGVRAHYNAATGEYDVLQENSGYRAKQNLYRWKPKAVVPAQD